VQGTSVEVDLKKTVSEFCFMGRSGTVRLTDV
jgi:hypothetical protein